MPDDEFHAALWQFADLHHQWASFICVKLSESWNIGIWPANEINIRPDSTSSDWLTDSLLVHFSPDKWQLTSSWRLWPGWTGVGNKSVLGAVLTGLSWGAAEVLMSAWNVIIGPGLRAWTSQSLNDLEALLTCRQWQTGNNSQKNRDTQRLKLLSPCNLLNKRTDFCISIACFSLILFEILHNLDFQETFIPWGRHGG